MLLSISLTPTEFLETFIGKRSSKVDVCAFWASFDRDPTVDVAILTGSGSEAFCAGADLKEYIPKWLNRTFQDVRNNVDNSLGGITRGMKVRKPIIAAVNGWALAGGFELALACDVRIASEAARFGSFEIRRGFHHGDGGVVRLVNSIGVSRTIDILYTSREITSNEAHGIGLVQYVVPPDALMTAAEDYALKLLEKSQVALHSIKETVYSVVGKSPRRGSEARSDFRVLEWGRRIHRQAARVLLRQDHQAHIMKCPKCHEAVQARQRFCPNCGTRLDQTAAPEAGLVATDTAEHRQISIVFTDIVQSTSSDVRTRG
jgi:enoyl-CoA hydratase/carnithine racemase